MNDLQMQNDLLEEQRNNLTNELSKYEEEAKRLHKLLANVKAECKQKDLQIKNFLKLK